MISDNQMDEFFKGRFRDYPSAVPEDMWERIMEKKKRDRMIWLFFTGLFAVVILSLGLGGGYFILNQKKSISAIGMDSTKINQIPIIADTLKANSSKADSAGLSSGQDQMQSPQINESDKKTKQKDKTRNNYSDNFDNVKTNTKDNSTSSKSENTYMAQPGPAVSSKSTDSNNVIENKKVKNKDSLGTKAFVKTPLADSSQSKNLKKPETKNFLNNRKWYVDLFISPDYPIVSPHEREQSKLSYTIGIKLNRSIGKYFTVKTGIQYSQVNIVGNDSVFGGSTMHLGRLDLPVLAGYLISDDNLKTTVNGGAIFNLYTWVPGSYNFFKTNTGVGLYLGVNFEEKINDKISLFAEPYYRYQLTSMTVSSVSSMKFIDIIGINIGARYYFKKKHEGK
jgi:hypothetical protein